jgi:glycosyltransferase involved in cell wall biosynthesis
MAYDVSIVGTVGLPARYGGFETLAEQLTQRLHEQLRLQVFCTTVGMNADRPKRYLGTDLHYVDWDANGWQSIVYDIVSLWRAAPVSKTLLVLGVSGCIVLPLIRLRAPRARIVTHIDGLEWRRRKWGWVARAFLRLSEWVAVHCSDAVIADNQAIADHVQSAYGKPSVLIAYGGDHVVSRGARLAPPETRFASKEYFLTICRIEPENNLREILEAFAATPSRQLVVVGNWAVSGYASGLKQSFSNCSNIEMKEPIYELPRLESLRKHACAYVHGHTAGGTNPSLVEAMTMGLAVLAFDVAYNRFTTEDQACYWGSSQELAALIAGMDAAAIAHNGSAMASIAERRYTWDAVTERYRATLAGGAL